MEQLNTERADGNSMADTEHKKLLTVTSTIVKKQKYIWL